MAAEQGTARRGASRAPRREAAEAESLRTTPRAGTDGEASTAGVIGCLLERLETDGRGLTTGEAARRLQVVGPNAILEVRRSLLAELTAFFWGPIPWMIEAADPAADSPIVSILLVSNATVGLRDDGTGGRHRGGDLLRQDHAPGGDRPARFPLPKGGPRHRRLPHLPDRRLGAHAGAGRALPGGRSATSFGGGVAGCHDPSRCRASGRVSFRGIRRRRCATWPRTQIFSWWARAAGVPLPPSRSGPWPTSVPITALVPS